MKTKELHNGMNIIDSRDVIARIKELEDELESAKEAAVDTPEEPFDEAAFSELYEDEQTELKKLKDLEEEASGSPDWTFGNSLIRDGYFEEYAQELAEDIGAIQKDAQWPNNHIDWEAAAEALQQDYMRVSFDGEDYWIRA